MDDLIPIGARLELKGLGAFQRGMDGAAAATDRAGKEIDDLDRAMGRGVGRRHSTNLRKIAGGLGSIAKTAGVATVAVAGLGAAALHKFGKFEIEVARIQTLLEPGKNAMQEYGELIKGNAVRFGQSAEQMSDAVFQSISAGIDPSRESIKEFSKVVGEAATGGTTSMATVVDGLTTVINAYGLKVDDAREISDAFFVANKLGKTTFEELSGSIGRVAPTANALGVSYKELLASTVSLTTAGIQTSEAMSAMKAVISNTAKPSTRAQKTAKRLGLQLGVAAIKAKGFANYLKDLVEKTKGDTQAQINLFKSVEAFNAIARLTSRTGLKTFNKALNEMRTTAGSTKKAFSDVADTTGFKLKQLARALERFAIEAGQGLAEGLGLDQIQNIPEAVARAARTVRASARNFAEGFKEAFAPVIQAGDFDWEKLSRTFGEAAGNLSMAFIETGKFLAGLVKTLLTIVREAKAIADSVNPNARKKERISAAKLRERAEGANDFAAAFKIMTFQWGDAADIIKRNRRLQREDAIDASIKRLASESKMGPDKFVDMLPQRFKARARQALFGEHNAAVARQRMETADLEQARFESGVKSAWNRVTGAVPDISLRDVAGGLAKLNAAPADLASKLMVNVHAKMDNVVEFKDHKARRGGRSFSSRGRGGATIESTARTRYMIFEDRIIPIADEFVFANLLDQPVS